MGNNLRHFKEMQKFGMFLLYVYLPIVLYKSYKIFSFVKDAGYLSIYTGKVAELHLPWWTAGSRILYSVFYLITITSYPPKKVFIKASFFYLISLTTISLSGGRNTLIVGLLLVIYFYSRFYSKKISKKTISIVFSFIIIFSIYIGYSRAGKEVGSINPEGLVTEIFYGQGNTIVVPLAVLEAQLVEPNGKLEYRNYPFIFTNVFSFIADILYPTPNWQTKVYLERHNNMGSIICNKLSPTAFRSGNGVGGNFIAEAYDCGGFLGIILWSAVLALFMLSIERQMLCNNYNLPVCFFIIGSIFILPRASFFSFLGNTFIFIFLVCFIEFINCMIYPKKLNMEVK
jgi:oligosaccharide repeat unit polymerase